MYCKLNEQTSLCFRRGVVLFLTFKNCITLFVCAHHMHVWATHAMVLGWQLVPFYPVSPRDQTHQTWQQALLELNHLSTPHCVFNRVV